MWYGLNGKLVNRKLPSGPVTAERFNPVTGFETSTVALAMEAPDGSLTAPSMDPEFPVWATMRVAQNKMLKLNAKKESHINLI
jgi:hypothetical protein